MKKINLVAIIFVGLMMASPIFASPTQLTREQLLVKIKEITLMISNLQEQLKNKSVSEYAHGPAPLGCQNRYCPETYNDCINCGYTSTQCNNLPMCNNHTNNINLEKQRKILFLNTLKESYLIQNDGVSYFVIAITSYPNNIVRSKLYQEKAYVSFQSAYQKTNKIISDFADMPSNYISTASMLNKSAYSAISMFVYCLPYFDGKKIYNIDKVKSDIIVVDDFNETVRQWLINQSSEINKIN